MTPAGQMRGIFVGYLVCCISFHVLWMGTAAKEKRKEETWIQCGAIVE